MTTTKMVSRNVELARVSLALLALAAGLGPAPAMANGLDLGGILGGAGSLLGGAGGALNSLPDVVNSASNVVTGITSPLMGAISPLTGGLSNGLGGVLSSSLGGLGTLTGGQSGLLGNTMRLATGAVTGLTSGIGNGLGGMAGANGLNDFSSPTGPIGISSPNGLGNPYASAALVNAYASSSAGAAPAVALRNNYKREAIADAALMGAAQEMSAGSEMMLGAAGSTAAVAGAVGAAAAAADAQQGDELGLMAGAAAAAGAGAGSLGYGGTLGAVAGAVAANSAVNAAVSGSSALNAAGSLIGRQALATDAIRNAQAESAAAGAEMVQHGAINARSASMASNAYRQAKLASARDRVDIAGTIQNSARISDAAIATHDTATKAEDSLLGSELAVDSAATVFDSDGAYIPPVTASLLRSLPYGRLGLRNIIPKPLTHPSNMLPDVWLNGMPVNYQNVPLKMLPYGIGPAQSVNSLMASQAALANGAIFNGQPFIANNGMVLNGLVFDPAYAYLSGGNGMFASSLMSILANGQLEAQDEIAMANLLNMQQLNGLGMASTYQGYGRLNPVPMMTGSVTDVTLMPTTTIGTTYPIGSALVIEPRDSFFQDFTDNASSRQNFDERQQ